MIHVRDLKKIYKVPVKQPGVWASVRSLFDREYREVRAVDGITFDIAAGERVGFLGPNGAGKTTTLKMMTGLLHPTSGEVSVSGFTPKHRDDAFLRTVTLVMGQKQQLLWDLPPTETFALHRALYDLDLRAWKESLDELVELLGLAAFMDQPARNLSLGQRMRCELAAALLHRPKILFLDEPTIGLDVEAQVIVRAFVSAYHARHGATLLLTSHDMDDVAAMVDRVLLIDQGVIRFDGSLPELARRFGSGRRLVVRDAHADFSSIGLTRAGETWEVTVDASDINARLSAVLARSPAAEVTVSDPPLEDVLRKAFGESRPAAAP